MMIMICNDITCAGMPVVTPRDICGIVEWITDDVHFLSSLSDECYNHFFRCCISLLGFFMIYQI